MIFIVALYCSLKLMKIGSNTITKLYSTEEIAKILNVSKVTVYRLIESKKIPFYKIKGSIRIAEKDVMEFLERNRVEPIE